MGAKKDKKKKTGPKGKKARAKAKLDQVWGEQYNEDERKESKIRSGKSRLQLLDGKSSSTSSSINKCSPTGGVGGKQREKEIDPSAKQSRKYRRDAPSTFDQFLERKKKHSLSVHHGQHGQQYRKKNGHKQIKEKEYNSDESSSSSEDDSSSESGMDGSSSFANLLGRMNGTKKKSAKKMMSIDNDDDDDDSDLDESDVDSDNDNTSSSSEESIADNANMEEQDSGEDSIPDNIAQTQVEIAPSGDPYEAHFSRSPLPQLQSDTMDLTQQQTQTNLVPHSGNIRKVPTQLSSSTVEVQLSGPLLDAFNDIATRHNDAQNGNKLTLAKQNNTAQTKQVWDEFALGPYQHVRQVLSRNWTSVNNKSSKKKQKEGIKNNGRVFTPLQSTIYPALSRYADVLLTNEAYQNRTEINSVLCLHILNHVLTSRTRLQRHNRRIKELANSIDDNDAAIKDDEDDPDKWRDQGYTRPKVLILLPTRGVCYDVVQCMISLLGDTAFVDNNDRFDEEYGPLLEDPDGNEEEEDGMEDEDKARRRKAVLKQKGRDWNELFGDTINSDDDFKIGLSLTPNVVKSDNGSGGKKKKKTKLATDSGSSSSRSGVHVKLFADFYHCDIILASPIGLKMATTGDNDQDGKDDDDADDSEEETDIDFLSSIDICLISRSDVLLMQNWDHVNTILDTTMNHQPKKIANIDFSRVRNYFLEGQGVHWRQLIVTSSFADPYILSTFRRHAKNVDGGIKIRSKVSSDDASICDVMVRVKQVFQRVACTSVADTGRNRLRYFEEHVLPKLDRLNQKHTLIYIPSYFDFIAVRNLLIKREVNFVSVTEYARVSEVSRGRARFLQGRKSIMLYTGRAHFFLRHKIKGARHVIFFGLPEYSDFYTNVVNMLSNNVRGNDNVDDDDGDITRMPMSCLSLCTKFDAHQLGRIVGTTHTERMIKGEKSSYMFCS